MTDEYAAAVRSMEGLAPAVAADDRRILWLEELRKNPEMLQLPPAIVPRLAWKGRSTLLWAKEKLGKSTVVGQATAALRRQSRFLDGDAESGKVAYLCLDEPLGDLVYRLESFGAVDGVAILDFAPTWAELRAMLEEVRPTLLVIDTITDFAKAMGLQDLWSASQWYEVLVPLRALAAEFNVAQIWIHHAVRNGERYADSRALGAKADVIIGLTQSSDDPNERVVETSGRNIPTHLRKYRLVYSQGRYELAGAELPVTTRVFDAIVREPGITKRRLRDLIGGRAVVTDEAVRNLLAQHLIRDHGTNGRSAFSAVSEVDKSVSRNSCAEPPRDTVRDTVSGHDLSDCGTRADTLRTRLGHATVSGPLKQGAAGTRGQTGTETTDQERLAIETEDAA